MATNYPSGTDSLTNPAGTSLLTSPDHASQHTNANDAIEAMQSTSGTTAGTNVLKHFSAGEFPVRHTGVAATGTLQQTLVGGTFNKNTYGSIAVTGGTFNNTIVGTPAITGGTANSIYLGTPTMSANAITTAYLKPTTISYEPGTATIFATASTSFTPITNGTTTYSVGTTNERLFLWLSAMFKQTNSSGAAGVTIQINGTNQTPELYSDAIAADVWTRQTQPYIVDLVASSTGTFIIVAKSTSPGTIQVHTSVTTFRPTIKGFAVGSI